MCRREVKSLQTVDALGQWGLILSRNQVEKEPGRSFFSGGLTQWPVLG